MKLTAFNYGKTEITEKMAFQNGSPDVGLPIALLFFLIETKDKKILVDVGCDTMPKFTLFEFQNPVDVLESSDINRSEITDILLTHTHHDHIDALRYYPQANVYLHSSEYEKALKYSSDSSKLHTFDDSFSITEDITIKHIGGHSRGSSIVLINDTYVLCGDECYTWENLLQNKPTGSSFCIEKSIAFVEEYRKPCYKQILFHDPLLVEELGYKVIFEVNEH